MRPIFLHGMWRSGSTYLWSRFRAADNTMCFYEPLHHGLAKLTRSRIDRARPDETIANRHPSLSEPYCQEYAPLIRGRGVRHYHPTLASERYCLERNADHPRLERYVAGLLDHAATRDRTPVLGFNRTGGRVAWLRDRFSSFDVLISRAPEAVWASYADCAARGNHTFLSMWLRVVEANQNDPVWAPLARRIGVRGPIERRLTSTRRRHAAMIAGMDAKASYQLTYYAWRVYTCHAGRHVDLVIDETTAQSPDLRRYACERILAETGVAVTLDDYRPSPPRIALDPAIQRRVEAEVAEIFPLDSVRRLDLAARPSNPAAGYDLAARIGAAARE